MESELLRIKRDQESLIKNQLDNMKAQIGTCDDYIKTLRLE